MRLTMALIGLRLNLASSRTTSYPAMMPEALHVVDQNRSAARSRMSLHAPPTASPPARRSASDPTMCASCVDMVRRDPPLASFIRCAKTIALAAVDTALDQRQCRRRSRVLFYRLVINRRCET